MRECSVSTVQYSTELGAVLSIKCSRRVLSAMLNAVVSEEGRAQP